jgi:methylenetetrahydrofolate reductase (NADPH)
MAFELSFEFFPPKTAEGEAKLLETRQQLSQHQPKFFSVTFGAGGSTRDRTMDTVLAIQRDGFEAAPHISGISSSREDILAMLQVYQSHGIRRLVVLRGDMPSGEVSASDFAHASDLVSFIRQQTGDAFHIEVAAYPETHPEAKSAALDMQHFKQKIDAGANGAITQYFYNADAYFQFVEQCQAMGVEVPIVPGIMPIYNYTQLARFSSVCGAEIPRWLSLRLQDYAEDPASLRALGLQVVSQLCQRLIDGGAPGLHFYTLNQANLISQIIGNLTIQNN